MTNDGFVEVTAENTPTWDRIKPITGKLVGVKSNVGPNESMLYTLQTDSGNIGVWGSTVLDTKFMGIQNGSMVKVEPMGQQKSPTTGRTYQDFKVFVKPPEFTEVLDGAEPLNDEPLPKFEG